MKCVAILAALLLGLVDWFLFIVGGVGSFFLSRAGGFDPDGAFFAAVLVGAAAMVFASARLPGRSRSLKDFCFVTVMRLSAHAGWNGTSPPTVVRAHKPEPALMPPAESTYGKQG